MVSRREHAARLLGDYPNALRFRAHAGSGSGRPRVVRRGTPATGRDPSRDLRELALPAADRRAAQRGRASRSRHPGARAESRSDSENGGPRSCRSGRARPTGVAIVAHSKGGLVGKHVMAPKIGRHGAVGRPAGGHRLAVQRLGDGPPRAESGSARLSGRRPGHRALAAERAVNERITSIYPSFDPHIPEGSALEGAQQHRAAGRRPFPHPASAGGHRRRGRGGRRLSERGVEGRV